LEQNVGEAPKNNPKALIPRGFNVGPTAALRRQAALGARWLPGTASTGPGRRFVSTTRDLTQLDGAIRPGDLIYLCVTTRPSHRQRRRRFACAAPPAAVVHGVTRLGVELVHPWPGVAAQNAAIFVLRSPVLSNPTYLLFPFSPLPRLALHRLGWDVLTSPHGQRLLYHRARIHALLADLLWNSAVEPLQNKHERRNCRRALALVVADRMRRMLARTSARCESLLDPAGPYPPRLRKLEAGRREKADQRRARRAVEPKRSHHIHTALADARRIQEEFAFAAAAEGGKEE